MLPIYEGAASDCIEDGAKNHLGDLSLHIHTFNLRASEEKQNGGKPHPE